MEPQILSSPLLCSLPKHYDQETRLNSQGAAVLIRLGAHWNNLLKKGGVYWSNVYSARICDERHTVHSTSLTVTHVEPLMETYFSKPMSLFMAKVASRLHSKLCCCSKCMKMRFVRTAAECLTLARCCRRRWSRSDRPACQTGAWRGPLELYKLSSHLRRKRQVCQNISIFFSKGSLTDTN